MARVPALFAALLVVGSQLPGAHGSQAWNVAGTQELLARATSAAAGATAELARAASAGDATPSGSGPQLCAWLGEACTLNPELATDGSGLPAGSPLRGVLLEGAACARRGGRANCILDAKCHWQELTRSCDPQPSWANARVYIDVLMPSSSCGWVTKVANLSAECAASAPGTCPSPRCIVTPTLELFVANNTCVTGESCGSNDYYMPTLLCGEGFDFDRTFGKCQQEEVAGGGEYDEVSVAECFKRSCADLGQILEAVARARQPCAPLGLDACSATAGCYWETNSAYNQSAGCEATDAASSKSLLASLSKACPFKHMANAEEGCNDIHISSACTGGCGWESSQACSDSTAGAGPLAKQQCSATEGGFGAALATVRGTPEVAVLADALTGVGQCRAAHTAEACTAVHTVLSTAALLFP